MAAEGEGMKTVMLRSDDGVDFVVSDAVASQCGRTIDFMTKYDYENHTIPSDDGGGTNYSPIRLFVQGDTLSKVIQYSKMHASGSQDFSDWDAEFIGSFHHETLFDLILASEYLQIRGLLGLACRTIASKIKGKSPHEICSIFNIKSFFSSELFDEETIEKRLEDPGRWNQMGMPIVPSEKPYVNEELELEEKALRALDIVRCQEFIGYDPKVKGYIHTRFDLYNLAFFDLDKETGFSRGPPLHLIPTPIHESIVESSVNVISLKVRNSDTGFPIEVFGTVLARDQVDYRCVHLFRRGSDDPQLITLTDDMLTLTDPCRGLVPADRIYFEIDLKIKCDGGVIKDLSKGVIVFNRVRLPHDGQAMTLDLNSWLSRVELTCAYVVDPVEATIEINIINGLCSLSRVAAWTSENFEDRIILYHGDEAAGAQTVIGVGGSVPLIRRVVAVPLGKKLVLHLTGDAADGVIAENLLVPISQTDELVTRKMGCGELEVRIAWTAVPRRQRQGMLKVVGNESLLI